MDAEVGSPLFARGQQLLQHIADINGFKLGPGQFRVDAGGVGDIVDQPVDTANIVICDSQQLFLQLLVLYALKPLQRGTKRGKGVLDLVADVCGERFGGVDPVAQCDAHVR